MTRKILFIVNPNAGKKIPERIISIIKNELVGGFNYQIAVWKDKDHFEEITRLLFTEGYTDAIAVGGDGTVNQVAKTILNKNIALGIIPVGSGNGLARSLGLSMDLKEAIKEIMAGNTLTIDHGTVNGIPFFCTSGVGFDAHIGNLFATETSRGLKTYARITLRELFKYRAKYYTIKFDDHIIRRKAFLITVANAGQYGNDFYIAPEADLNDGLFHVVILKPFNIFSVTGIFSKIIRRKAHLSRAIETYVSKSVQIQREEMAPIHFDGEPKDENLDITFENIKRSLTVIVGKKFIGSTEHIFSEPFIGEN